MTDAFGLALSGADEATTESIVEFQKLLLNFDDGADCILPAAEAAPQCAMAQCYAAALHVYGQSRDDFATALKFLDVGAAAETDDRERRTVEALRTCASGDFETATAQLEALTVEYPRDLTAAKLCEFLYFCRGQAFSGKRFRDHMVRLEDEHSGNADYLAMRAFAFELSGDQETALSTAREAVAIRERTPWAHHAIAHAHQVLGDNAGALLEIAPLRKATWSQTGRLIHCHNAWHEALMHLSVGNANAAWAIFRGVIWTSDEPNIGEQVDAISLLWRLEMKGEDVPQKLWADVASYAAPYGDDALVLFNSAHLVYALERAGRTTDGHLREMREQIGDAPDALGRVWNDVGWRLLEAVRSAARGDYARCREAYEPLAKGAFLRSGGSDAQCALFTEMYSYSRAQDS